MSETCSYLAWIGLLAGSQMQVCLLKLNESPVKSCLHETVLQIFVLQLNDVHI